MGHSLPILRQGVGLRISARRQAPLGRGSRDRRTSARSLPFCADGAPNCGQVICNVRHNKHEQDRKCRKAMGDPPPRRPRRRLRTRGRGSPLARAGNRGQADRYPDQGPDDVVAAGMQEIKNDAQGREKWRTGKGQMGQAPSPNLRLVRRRLTSGPACGIHEYDERNVSGVIAGARVISTASAANHAYVRSLGADEVIDYNASATQRRCPTAMRSSIRSAAMSRRGLSPCSSRGGRAAFIASGAQAPQPARGDGDWRTTPRLSSSG
jgi:hypothetical protein